MSRRPEDQRLRHDGQRDRTDIPKAGKWWQEYYDAISTGEWDNFKRRYGM